MRLVPLSTSALYIDLDQIPMPQPEPSGPRGFMPTEVAGVSGALRLAGLYSRLSHPDAFLGNVLTAIAANGGSEPTPALVRAVLDAALVAYSDADGDGAPDVAPITDAEALAVWAALEPLFASAP